MRVMAGEKDEREPRVDMEIASEDAEAEAFELEAAEEHASDTLKKLTERVRVCEKEKRELLENLQRVRADFLNARRRLEERAHRDREQAVERHVQALLPLCDSFDLALNDSAWSASDAPWKKGVESIKAQLAAVLRSYGVEVIEPLGERFDPREHEALTDNGGGQLVTAVLQKGYKRGEIVIRPAKVVIG
jgi:molecular chaperone GrpE